VIGGVSSSNNLSAAAALVDGLPQGLEVNAVMFAVTAPGADVLPWDEHWCRELGPHKHSGMLGCRVSPTVASEWNRTMDKRWSKLHRRAATEVRRKLGNDAVVLVARALELQHRGVKHAHPVLLAATPRQRKKAKAQLQHTVQHPAMRKSRLLWMTRV
jgi:hypothetical protein